MMDVVCPRCQTKNERYFAVPILAQKDVFVCSNNDCRAMLQRKPDGTPVDLTAVLEKVRLGDDLISAVSPDTVAGKSILQAVDRFESQQKTVTLAFVGEVRALMQQLEGRAHFLHGELAKRAVADASFDDLVATAKQVVDLVSARPDGIQKDGT